MNIIIEGQEYNVKKVIEHKPATRSHNYSKKLEKYYVNIIDSDNIYHIHVLVGPDNRIFESLTDACEYYNMPITGVYNRISARNWDFITAITKPFIKRNCPVIDPFTGKQFSSLSLMLSFYGISLSSYNKEFEKSNNMKEAMENSLLHHRKCKSERFIDPVDGEEMESLNDCCRKHGITVTAYKKRCQYYGMSPVEALSKPLKLCYVQDDLGNYYQNEAEMCEFYGISVHEYRNYIKLYNKSISKIVKAAKENNMTIKEYSKKNYRCTEEKKSH